MLRKSYYKQEAGKKETEQRYQQLHIMKVTDFIQTYFSTGNLITYKAKQND